MSDRQPLHEPTRWLSLVYFRIYPAMGCGLRVGSHYWHLRRDPHDIYSERHKIGCNWWQAGRWRLTHRWGVGAPQA